MLLLLSEWCDGAAGRACSDEKLEQLNKCIRYSCLPTPYLTELWKSLHTPLLTYKQRMALLHFKSLPEEGQNVSCNVQREHDPSIKWFESNRGTSEEGENLTEVLTLEVSGAELYRLIREPKEFVTGRNKLPGPSSPRVYARGFFWSLELASSHKGTLWCGLKVFGVSSLLTREDGLATAQGLACKYQVKIKGAAAEDDFALSPDDICIVTSEGIGESISAAEGDELAPLDPQWWRLRVVEGSVTFEAHLTIINH